MKRASLHPAEKYAYDVLDGRIPACVYVKQAAQRYFDDLKNLPKKGYYFDRKKAAAVIDWVPAYCHHYRGDLAKTPLYLLPWQQFIYWQLFGWKKKDGNRRFNYCYVEVPKKNGKTTGFLAPIALFMLTADSEAGPEVYFAAGSRDQAKIAYNDIRAMISASPILRACLYPNLREIKPTKNAEEYGVDPNLQCYPVSSEAGNLDGKNVHFSGIDEYHNHQTVDVFNIMSSGMIARSQPLQFTITTAGFNKFGPCYQYREAIINILSGISEDDHTLGIIYTLDEEDNWQDENNWVKANPSIGYGKSLDKMRSELTQKKQQGSSGINEFKTKQLNLWVDAAKTWIPDEKVKACMIPSDQFPKLDGEPCFLGLDLAAIRDITAMAVGWRYEGKVYVKLKYWLPSDVLEERKSLNDKHPYIQYCRDGLITLTPGNVTDYEYIRKKITGISSHEPEFDNESVAGKYNIISLGYDKWNSTHVISEISSDGVDVNEVGQGYGAMNYPMKQLEKMIYSGDVVFENDKVLRWMFANTQPETDSTGNIRPKKKTAEKKIDGVVAILTMLSELFRNETDGGNYIPENYTIKTIK